MANDGKGYKLPTEPDSQFTACVSFRIPINPEYWAAARGAVLELTKWYNWEKEPTHRARVTAELMRELILPSLQLTACPATNLEGFGYWYWNLVDNSGVWEVCPIQASSGSETISLFQAGQGFISQCIEPGYTQKGTALRYPFGPIGECNLWVRVAGLLFDDLFDIDGGTLTVDTSTGITPQWVYIGRFNLTGESHQIQILREGCEPDTFPRISGVCVQTFKQPIGSYLGQSPL